MPLYRIYALIHGETLPEEKILGCEIKKMSFSEQEMRKFAPIQSVYAKDEYLEYEKTYATFLPYIDPMRISSEYVAVYEIQEENPNAALGGAIKAIDRVCRFLSIAQLEDVKRNFGRDRGAFEPYVYQVNKVYEVNSEGVESEANISLRVGFVYLPKRPEFNTWRDKNIPHFLEEISNFPNNTLQKALKYLYRSSIGHFLLDSREKVALDHMKSIEIIVDDLSSKRDFKDRLEDAANKLGLTPEEKRRIQDFWDDRSTYGDIAHATEYDNTERYPNQFPLPSNVQYTGGAFDSVAASVCIKYFYYIKSFVVIEIDEPNEFGKEGTFTQIYRLWPEKNGTSLCFFCFFSNQNDKPKLKEEIKKAFAIEFGYDEKDIAEAVWGVNKKTITLRLKSEI